MKRNKGFTLVELLAVIVIIGILATIAITEVTKTMQTSRAKTFIEDSRTIVESVREDLISGTIKPMQLQEDIVVYDLNTINQLLDKKLTNSPFGGKYKEVSVMAQKNYDSSDAKAYRLYICVIDENGNGFNYTQEKNLQYQDMIYNDPELKCKLEK